jgi:glycerate 2-kinase
VKRVLVAPDAFKGTMTAPEVAAAIGAGLARAGAQSDLCPVADGGEGTIDVLLQALGGEQRHARATDPLGRAIQARWATLSDGTAVVESAQASGLALLSPDERDAVRASSAGTGELLLAAARSGARRILLAVGGTASTDGGAGLLEAVESGGGLPAATELIALCDVRIPFEQAARTFAPQKGADAKEVVLLDSRLAALTRGWRRVPSGVPMTGAGGGLAGGVWACLGAELRPGAQAVLDAVGFERRLTRADAVIVGEGCLDEQSFAGKAPGAVAERAAAHGVPVHAIVGRHALPGGEHARHGLASVRTAGTPASLRTAASELAASL